MTKANRAPALPLLASHLAELLPRERLHPAVLDWVATASTRASWSIAFSGGPDSLALLLLLWAHWPERRSQLRALHFDHRMRAKNSRRDVAFCRAVCRKLDLPLLAGRWPGRHADASEAEARAARMAFFEAHARILWLGHQQDDIAESMLMRFARGSGTAGLAAPRPIHLVGRRTHLRPLLSLKKSEIVEALRAARISWQEDETNAGDRFFRNRIRRSVIPAWEKAAGRDAVAGAARSRLLLEEDDAALESWLASLGVLRGGTLDLGNLRGKPRALWRRALHHWLRAEVRVGELSRQAFEALLAALEAKRRTRQSAGRQGFAVTDGDRLWFETAAKPRRTLGRRAN